MTLDEIWRGHRLFLCLVAARPSGAYVPLALKDWRELEELSEEDRYASDWFVAEVVPHDCDADHPETGLCALSGKEADGAIHICRNRHLTTFHCPKHGTPDRFTPKT